MELFFLMCNFGLFILFMDLCTSHSDRNLQHFSSLQIQTLDPHSVHFSSLETTALLSVSTDLPVLDTSCMWKHVLRDLLWPASLISYEIGVHPCCSVCQCFFSRLNDFPLYRWTTFYLICTFLMCSPILFWKKTWNMGKCSHLLSSRGENMDICYVLYIFLDVWKIS